MSAAKCVNKMSNVEQAIASKRANGQVNSPVLYASIPSSSYPMCMVLRRKATLVADSRSTKVD